MKFCVYTRTFYESPYINFFIEHYLKLGFEKIIILKTDNLEIKINNKFLNNIEVKEVENKGDDTLRENLNIIKESNYDWVLSIDNDEFLFLESKFSNIREYVDNILSKKPETNIILFRWLMVNKFNNKNVLIEDIIKNYKIKKNFFIKSLFKNLEINKVNSHFVTFKDVKENIFLENLEKVKTISMKYDLNENSYNNSCIIHVYTRSFNNLILKSLKTKFKNKAIINKENFINFVNNIEFKKMNDEYLINKLNEIIGNKIKLPINQNKREKFDNKLFFKNFRLFDYESKFLDEKEEKENLETILKENNINIENYYSLSDRVIEIFEDKKYFLV